MLEKISFPFAIYFLFFLCGLLFFSCERNREKAIAGIKMKGLVHLNREEIISYLGYQSENQEGKETGSHSFVDPKKWEEKLTKHPRIQNASVRWKRSELYLEITEKKPVGVIQIENNLYEIDESFSILSKNDVRLPWTPTLSGHFKKDGNRLGGATFYSIWNQSQRLKKDFPELWKRISEIESRKDGDIFIYFHSPKGLSVNVGSFLSSKQARKLYSGIAFLEARSRNPVFLDLRGEDAFYY